jgi:hypothetical protein
MKRSKNLPDKQQADQGLIDFFTAESIANPKTTQYRNHYFDAFALTIYSI